MKLAVTVCEPVPEVRPVSEKLTEGCPAATAIVVEVVPSVKVAVPARALVSERVPLTEYWLVADWQVPGVTDRAMASVQAEGAVYVVVVVPQPGKLTVTVCEPVPEDNPGKL